MYYLEVLEMALPNKVQSYSTTTNVTYVAKLIVPWLKYAKISAPYQWYIYSSIEREQIMKSYSTKEREKFKQELKPTLGSNPK